MSVLPFPHIQINGFRGLAGLHLESCGRVNLLVGGNNSGKTSVLESLLLLAAPLDVRQWEGAVELRSTWPLHDVRFRGGAASRLDALSWLFPHHGEHIGPIDLAGGSPVGHVIATAERIVGEPPKRPILNSDEVVESSFGRDRWRASSREADTALEPGLVIDIQLNRRQAPAQLFEEPRDRFRMVLWESGRAYRASRKLLDPALPIAYVTPISHRSDGFLAARVGGLLRARKKDQAIELLRRLDPRVNDLVMVTPEDVESSSPVPMASGRAALHVDYEGTGLVPVHAMGDGMRRALHFATVIANVSDGGVLLVDEIEVGMHTSVLEKVFAWLCKACASAGVQLFATTHSLEAVDAMLEGMPDKDLVLYRLKDGQAKRFGGELLRTARFRLGQEVR